MKVVFRRGFLDMTLLFIIVVIALGAILTTGFKSKSERGTEGLIPEALPPGEEKKSLQLNTLKFRRAEIPQGNACLSNRFNDEAYIFVGSDPPAGGVARPGGQIRVWVDDEAGGSVAPGEQIDSTTGQVTQPGDRAATDGSGPGYYLWEPAIYITPLRSPDQQGPFSGDAENGGTPHFPIIVKGEVKPGGQEDRFLTLPPVEDPTAFDTRSRTGRGGHMAQYTWNVNDLGLAPGIYRAQFVIHDGDGHAAINCITIQI